MTTTDIVHVHTIAGFSSCCECPEQQSCSSLVEQVCVLSIVQRQILEDEVTFPVMTTSTVLDQFHAYSCYKYGRHVIFININK